jgi:hypothetical protein
MSRGDIAESLLSLITSPERAASTAGDLVQEGATKGKFWFWSRLLRTTGALVLREWADHTLRITGLAFGACLINGLLFVISIVAIFVVGAAALEVTQRLGLDIMADYYVARAGSAWTTVVSQIVIGRWLARRSPGKELAACLAFVCVGAVLSTVSMLAIQRIGPETFDMADFVMTPISSVVVGMFLFIGVDQARKKSVGVV